MHAVKESAAAVRRGSGDRMSKQERRGTMVFHSVRYRSNVKYYLIEHNSVSRGCRHVAFKQLCSRGGAEHAEHTAWIVWAGANSSPFLSLLLCRSCCAPRPPRETRGCRHLAFAPPRETRGCRHSAFAPPRATHGLKRQPLPHGLCELKSALIRKLRSPNRNSAKYSACN